MDVQTWLAFFVASCLIAISPGSGAVLSMSHGLNYGVRKAGATILGLQLGLLLVLVIAGALVALRNEGVQGWLTDKINAALEAAPPDLGSAQGSAAGADGATPAIRARITHLSGALPFEFALGVELYDAQGLWLRLPAHWRAADFAEHADRAGVSIVPASAFATVAHPVEAVRISLGVAPDRGDLEDGLIQLASLMSQPAFATRAVV